MDIFANTHGNSLFGLCSDSASLPDVDYRASRIQVGVDAPYKGRIYDPACGSGGMFVQSETFVESHGGKLGDISISGKEQRAWDARFGRAELARRVRLRRKQSNQCNPTTRQHRHISVLGYPSRPHVGSEYSPLIPS